MVFKREFEIKSVPVFEVLRYMRAGKDPDENIVAVVRSACEKVISASKCVACYITLPIEAGADSVKIGGLELVSKSLSTHLYECCEAVLFCASAGVGVDREIQKSAAVSALESLACDCAGSALVEELCDRFEEDVLGGADTTRRFSPGYGDLSIEYQRDIVALLDTKRHIGVSVTDGLMMTPTKSVTAIIGVKKRN